MRLKKKIPYEESGITATPPNSRYRGGWITEDPGEDFSHRKYGGEKSSWSSPATPSTSSKRNKISSSRSSKQSWKGFGTTPYQRIKSPASSSRHMYSGSRFGNSSNGGNSVNYDSWW